MNNATLTVKKVITNSYSLMLKKNLISAFKFNRIVLMLLMFIISIGYGKLNAQIQTTMAVRGTINSFGNNAMTYRSSLAQTWIATVQAAATNASAGFLFANNGSFSPKWARGAAVSFNSQTTWFANGADGTYNQTNGNFYTFICQDQNGGTNSKGYLFETSSTPVSVTTVAQSALASSVTVGQSVTVTATTSASLPTGQGVFLRYSTDNFSTSTIVNMTGSLVTYSATIPSATNTAGANVVYYVFTSGGTTAPATADADLATINLNNNIGSNYSYTVKAWTTAANGNWSDPATWISNTVPPTGTNLGAVTIAHNVTQDQNAIVSSIAINSSRTLTASANTLTISNNSNATTFSNSGTLTASGTHTVTFAGTGTHTISGIQTFQNVATSTGVNFGTNSTIAGSFQLNSGGFISTNAPIYASSSTLIYNSGGTYGRGTEWSATSGAGYPNNVTLSNSTNLTVVGTNSYTKAAGTLTVGTGSTFAVSGLTSGTGGVGVEFLGNINNDGAITLSGGTNQRLKAVTLNNGVAITDGTSTAAVTLSATIGGDLELTGNYNDNASFTASQRAVFFTGGSNIQTIGGNAPGTFNLDYIVVTKTASGGSVRLLKNLLTGAPNGGNGVTLTASANDIFELNGFTFTLGTTGLSSSVSGNGLFRGSSASNMSILGSGVLGTINFDQTSNNTTNALSNFTVNRTSSGSIVLGNTVRVGGTFLITAGTVGLAGDGNSANILTLGTLGTQNTTWGSTASTLPAARQNNTYFTGVTGTGSISVTTDTRTAAVINTAPSAISSITYGAALSTAGLTGGSASPAGGTFAYTTPSATPSVPGGNQSVTYTPALVDQGNYTSGTVNVNVTVNKATPTATLSVTNSPATYTGSGQAATVGITTSSVPGSVSSILTGGAATQTAANTYAVTASFVPTDGTNYNTVTGISAGNFIIGKATPTATLAVTNSPATYTGSGQAATVGITTSSVPGSVSSILTGGAATQIAANTYAVTASFVPTDGTNYNTITGISAGSFVIVEAIPTVTVTNNTTPYTYTGSPLGPNTASNTGTGSSYTYSYAGTGGTTYGPSATQPTSVGTYTVTATVAANGNYAQASSSATAFAINAAPITSTNWQGGNGGSWNSTGNWTTGIPDGTLDVIINSGYPVLDVDFTLPSGKSLTISGTGSLVINPTQTLTIAGTANFGDKSVTIKSNATGTGAIGNITGSLSGATNVIVERYIPAHTYRAWRLLSVPTMGSQTIRQAWQEGTLNPTALDNNKPGYGTQITQPGTNSSAVANGFDNNSLANSLLLYDGTAWQGAATTNTNIETKGGYFLYIRGERTQGTTGALTATTATTLRTIGTLYIGDVTTNTTAGSYDVIGNVYPSSINFGSLVRTGGVDNTFYIWDAKKISGNSLGFYQTFSSTNSFNCLVPGGSYTVGQPNTSIESGQAFFVHSTGTGSITLKESAKISGGNSNGFRPASPASNPVSLTTRMYSLTGTTSTIIDANEVVFDPQYQNAVDGNDALKMSNPGVNFAILQQNKTLAIEGRQPVTDKDTIFFNMWNMPQQQYKIEFVPENLNMPGLTAVLQDKHTGINSDVNLAGINSFNFTVDASAGSAAADRFRIVFKQNSIAPLAVNFISITANRSANGTKVSWKVAAENAIAQYEVERSNDGRSFNKIGAIAGTAQDQYNFTDAQQLAGTSFYRIKSIGVAGYVKYSNIVKLVAGNIKPGFSISPNPAEGNMVNLQFKNQPEGKYDVRISSINGQLLYSSVATHTGGSSTLVLNITERLGAGTYQLEIIAPDKSRQTQSLVVKSND